MSSHEPSHVSFQGLTDLASARLGGRALAASDEFFAEKENLLRPEVPVSVPKKFTDRGQWMDGWESRRRRGPGHDWVLLRLGLPGVLRGVDIDTAHFLGNHPPYASLEALDWHGLEDVTPDVPEDAWTEILGRSPLAPGSHNLFAIHNANRWTHLRLHIYPDGGVARFRAYGLVQPETGLVHSDEAIDLASVVNGGMAVACSDMFFSRMENLLLPGPAQNMGDGWETRRRRGPGHDWVIVRLGKAGHLDCIEVDTSWFKGNFPEKVSIDGCHSDDHVDQLNWDRRAWTEILPPQTLQADALHTFRSEILETGPWTHLRMNIFPDGGVARLRAWGWVVEP